MQNLNYKVIVVYLILFSSPTLIDIVFGRLATPLELFLIALLWLYSLLVIYPRLHKGERNIPDVFLGIIFTGSLILVGVSWGVREIPVSVIIYRLFSYFSFYPLVYLLLYLRRKHRLVKKLLITTILVCNFVAIGVVLDSQGLLINTPIIGEKIISLEAESYAMTHKLRGGQRRGAFFLGGSTAVYPFLSLGVLSSLILFKLEKEKYKYLWGTVGSLIFVWWGCFFSLSRAPLLLATLLLIFSISKLFVFTERYPIGRKYLLILFCLLLLLISPHIQHAAIDRIDSKASKVLTSGISPQETGNSSRYYAWYRGTLLFNDLDSWLGYGLGTSTLAVKNNKLLSNSQYRFHYESTIFSTFSEGGLVGLLLLLTPILLVLSIAKNHSHRDIYLFWLGTLLLNFFAAPIYGYSAQLAYFTGMSFCFAFKPVIKKD